MVRGADAGGRATQTWDSQAASAAADPTYVNGKAQLIPATVSGARVTTKSAGCRTAPYSAPDMFRVSSIRGTSKLTTGIVHPKSGCGPRTRLSAKLSSRPAKQHR